MRQETIAIIYMLFNAIIISTLDLQMIMELLLVASTHSKVYFLV